MISLKKFNSTLIILLVVFMCSISSAFASTGHVNITSNIQEKPLWCWAATSKSVISWLYSNTKNPSQSSIVTAVKGSPINDSAYLSEDVASLTKFQVANAYKVGTITFDSVKTYITGWQSPIKAGIGHKPKGGHSLLIYGYYESGATKNVHYMDPLKDKPRFNKVSYDYFVDNQNFYWKWTIYGNRKA